MKFALLLLSIILACGVQAQLGFHSFYDNEARDWALRRVITNSSSVNAQGYSSATRWMLWIKSHDLRTRIGRANVYFGADTNALECPLINQHLDGNAATEADTLVAWVATNYTSTGAKLNGSTQYINTGVGANALGTASDFHAATYSRTSVYEVGGTIGSANTIEYVNYFLYGWVDNNCYFYFDTSDQQVGGSDPTPPTGFYVGTRTSQTNRFIYKNGSSLLTSTTDVGSGPAMNANAVYVHGLDVNNALNSPTTRELCFYAAGRGIPTTLQGRYYYGVQRMQYEAGRQIVP